jgi:hypothetical protein
MPNISTQTRDRNYRILNGVRKNFFDCQKYQRFENINTIKRLIDESDLKKFCNNIGLKVSAVKLTPNDEDIRDHPTKVKIMQYNVREEEMIHKWMVAKDVTNMSFRKYRLLRTILNGIYSEKIPGWKKIFVKQNEINDFFKLEEPNQNGFYYDPSKKFTHVCEKFLSRSEEFRNSGERCFKIKLSADSMNLSKKHLTLLNFTFNLLNDTKNAMSVFGTFILGNFALILNFIIDIKQLLIGIFGNQFLF